MGKQEMEMTETILNVSIPENFSVLYEAKGVKNTVANQFIKQSDMVTQCITTTEFQFKEFMKIAVFFMPGALRNNQLNI